MQTVQLRAHLEFLRRPQLGQLGKLELDHAGWGHILRLGSARAKQASGRLGRAQFFSDITRNYPLGSALDRPTTICSRGPPPSPGTAAARKLASRPAGRLNVGGCWRPICGPSVALGSARRSSVTAGGGALRKRALVTCWARTWRRAGSLANLGRGFRTRPKTKTTTTNSNNNSNNSRPEASRMSRPRWLTNFASTQSGGARLWPASAKPPLHLAGCLW